MSTRILPPSRPAWQREQVATILALHGLKASSVTILGVRGYYRDSMGKLGRNDVGIYDDAIFVYSSNGCHSFNANTDPSVLKKQVAVLRAGLWLYKIGIHGLSKPPASRYKALVQAGKVTVDRYKTGPDTGEFGINIHKGGFGTTSSEGCQTIYPDQWPAFIALVESELKRAGQKIIPYLLVEQQG